MLILAIETSCDDTGVTILDIEKSDKIKIIADFVSSQTAIHAPWGGVVPNLAVRAHYKNLPILLEKAFGKIDSRKIDLIAVTIGPGLEPCLWAGVNTARVLAKAMDKPIVGVNHLEGHVAANFIAASSKLKAQSSKLIFPAICLIVSGGHTQIVLMKGIGKYDVIGQTRDDAAGEAFDKVAKLLGLRYPGGPQIALKAKKGDVKAFNLPRPMIVSKYFDFSFSGLKTAVRYLLNPPQPPFVKGGRGGARRPSTNHQSLITDICASFQQAVIDVLVEKTIRAAKQYKAKSIMFSGGVAANQELRRQMASAVKKNIPNSKFYIPDSKYCVDNAAMIGLAGYWKHMRQGKGDKIKDIVVKANLNF